MCRIMLLSFQLPLVLFVAEAVSEAAVFKVLYVFISSLDLHTSALR